MPDMLFILLLALVILGPAKLPQLARQLGKYKTQFKQIQRELTNQIEAEMRNIETTKKHPTAVPSTAPTEGHLSTQPPA